MAKINIKTARKVVPMCYAYTTPQIRNHDGWTKIGFTEQDVDARIRQQTQTADIKYVLEWKANALYDDGSGDVFHDTDFHAYLQKNGVERKEATEWFQILPVDSKSRFYTFRSDRGILKTVGAIGYKLRTEQKKAVEQTKNYFNAHLDEEPEFLWNAKPRFSKTLSTYDLCKSLNARKILIVTNRPAIANSWYDDYAKFFGTESGYYFVSDAEALKGLPFVVSRGNWPGDAKGYIEFVSLQDLKGSVYFGGSYDKLNHLTQIHWDLLVIDEAHEGVDTYKTDVAFDKINRDKTLHLSGTPFKALANSKFGEDAIFNWTYADEQKAKRNWNCESEEENPYADLPALNLFTYQISEIVLEKVAQGADFDDDGEKERYAFDLNEFFVTNAGGTFVHDVAVNKFLDALATQEKFPFSTPELREELKHTFWLLNRVDSAKALAKKLKSHPLFNKYEIVLAAGDGKIDDAEENKKAYNKVKTAIQKFDKTITLSVGQLTTGVTIPEWTAVLMLSNVKSPALYMQAAFRAQNPCLFNVGGQLLRKENAYVFDFDPARTLEIFEKFANDLSADTTNGKGDADERKQHVRELLNFFPVYGEDNNGEMIALDAEKVLSIPRKIHAKEVVRHGFMSNFLFQNIGNIFGAPKTVIDILQRLPYTKEPVAVTPQTKDDLSLNANGEVEIPEETIIGRANDIFGDKIYKTSETLKQTVSDLMSQPTPQEDSLAKIKEAFKDSLKENLVNTVKETYGREMTKATENAVVRKINSDTDAVLEKHYGDYKIKSNVLENERKKELQTSSAADIEKINEAFNKKQEEIKESFVAALEQKTDEITKNTALITVNAVETDKKQQEKSKLEDGIKAHLRGFSRTIPSFLMAYGTEATTLENFDTIIPDNVFKEVTTIDLADFRFLRDGGDYTDEETGETKHYDGHLFDSVVFNDSVKEFLSLKKKLADYFDETQKEDIFDYIPPQKNNQIFTPKKVVKEMVDNLEQENPGCFDNPDHTFIDLYMKSGMYITEIVKRLYNSEKMKTLYPDNHERLKHIFAYQVYGLAPTEIIYRIATAYILGFDDKIHIEKNNLKLFDTLPSAQKGTLETDLDTFFEE